ncbi:response regulator [Chryseolinea lacunae]|uniref:Response regulator n=1 Tax=Chryseolinea lacunae TaxID=2801331 RepID=A0ABS1KNK5_9BACT|nr:response regulator [Chryseolinea lacunae]MBL0740929.1 response regulator [Chryseolinea lacunae]
MNRIINILLVEDDRLDQIDVMRTLEKKQILHRLKIANNGEEAWEMMEETESSIFTGPPDIILLDLNMPKLNGFELATRIKSHPVFKDIRIFMLTTSEEHEDKAAARKLGVTGFITKPLKLQSPTSTDAFNLMIDLMNMGK